MNRLRLDYLLLRLKLGRGNRAVLIAEIVKTYNEGHLRRDTDLRIQGWRVVGGGLS